MEVVESRESIWYFLISFFVSLYFTPLSQCPFPMYLTLFSTVRGNAAWLFVDAFPLVEKDMPTRDYDETLQKQFQLLRVSILPHL
jgi:hypothetical protein